MTRLSTILNVILAMITLWLVLYWIVRVSGTECFNWFDYGVSFGTLFINITVNMLATLGK